MTLVSPLFINNSWLDHGSWLFTFHAIFFLVSCCLPYARLKISSEKIWCAWPEPWIRHDWICNNSKSHLLEVSRAVCQQQPHSPSVHDGYTDWDLRSAASAQHLCSYVCTCSSQKQKRKNLLNWTNLLVPPNTYLWYKTIFVEAFSKSVHLIL